MVNDGSKSKRRIALLGSTGSIGCQAVDVLVHQHAHLRVTVLTSNANASKLIEQALLLKPRHVVIVDERKYSEVKDALQGQGMHIHAGAQALCDVVQSDEVDRVLAAVVGYAGLQSVLTAVEAGKDVALANKETLVVAGELIMQKVKKKNALLIPVDSEHSAIFQCLLGESPATVEKIWLTASGGPFLGRSWEQLQDVRLQDALSHPTWKMGAKITIDSATLMNKGLEVIEARWLFDLQPDQIEVVVHPQSILHSMVQFCDGSVKAQLGLPDMRVPIQFALTYPERLANQITRFDFFSPVRLTFEPPDLKTFRNLALAYEALRKGGNMPCILNAANEMAVQAFLEQRLSFTGITEVVERSMMSIAYIKNPTYEDYVQTDRATRSFAQTLLSGL